jgi:predicted esterase
MCLVGRDAARARVAAMASTGLGLVAMVCSPLARSEGPGATAISPPAVVFARAGEGPRHTSEVAGEAPSIPSRTRPKEPEWVERGGAKALVFPPAAGAAAPRPVTVLLHGMCGHPERACAPFVDVSTANGWLVCPSAEDACGTGAKWRLVGKADAQVVEASVAALGSEHAGEVDEASPRVLVGFSLGGIAAMQITQAAPAGRYVGLVVVAAQVQPDVGALRRAGIQRVVFAAGDLDMTSVPLQADARRLDAHGLPTRFVSLGHFAHGYPADMQERMREPMRWVVGG